MATGTCFLNVDEAVLEWAWQQYDNTATRRQKILRNKDRKNQQKYIRALIDWTDVRVVDSTHWSSLSDVTTDSVSSSHQQALCSNSVTVHRPAESDVGIRPAPAVASTRPQASVLFHTHFTNNTPDIQEYTMRTQKTTRSTITTSIETGFTRGYDISVKLSAPCQVFEANAGYKREFSLTKVDGEVFEEELSWGVESQIHVQPQHVAEATLMVDERRQTGSFVVETRMRGTVYVSFTAPRDNNAQVKAVGNDICDVVERYMKRERKKGGGRTSLDDIVELTSDHVVVVKTRGSCKFRYGVQQQIRVDQIPLTTSI